MKIGDIVIDYQGFQGIITENFNSWDDLKKKSVFLTIDHDDQGNKMDMIEKLINGDPRDKWLDLQTNKHNNDELVENWYTVHYAFGGSGWLNQSRLRLNSN